MNISSSNQRKAGVILQYLQMGLGILIQLIYTPIMLKILGDNEYGIYSLSNSIISYLSLLSLGFGASYIRFYSIYKKTNEEDRIKRLNGMYLSVFMVIGVVALIAGLVLSQNVSIFYNDTYTPNDLHIAKILMIFLSINLAISFPSSVFTSYITSQEKFIWQKIVNMFTTVLSPAVNIILLYLGYGSIGMVITTTSLSILVMLVNIWFCFKKLNMKISFRGFDWHLFKDIFVFSIFIAINQIIDQINWQTDKVILGKMVNGTAVAIYSVASNINNMYIQFSTAISSVFAPKVNTIVAANKPSCNDELTDLMIKVGRVQLFVINLVLTGFIFFGQFFISHWAGEEYSLAYYVVLLLICPVTISLIQNIGIEIRRAKNKHQIVALFMLITALINVGISIWFAYLWGVVGVAFGTTLSLLMNIIIIDIFYQFKLKLNMVKFYKHIILCLPSMILPCIAGVLMMIYWKPTNWYIFLSQVVIYTLIYCISVFFIGLNKNEKSTILAKIKRKKAQNYDNNI